MPKKQITLTSIQNRINRDHIQYNAYVSRDASHEPLVVYQSGVKRANLPGFMSGPAIYDHYIIHYITSGKGTYLTGDQCIPLEKGDAFLIRPFDRVRYQADEEEPYLYYWVGFNGTEAEKLVHQCGFDNYHLTIHYEKDDAVLKIMKTISETPLSYPAQEYYILGLLYQLFSLIIDNNEMRNTNTDQSHFYKAACYIRTHISEPSLSVNDVAAYLGVHRSHLYKVFQHTINQSVQQFIQKMRFDKAKELLTHTSHSITDIASTCGFSDVSHFSILFREKEGISPKYYRQSKI